MRVTPAPERAGLIPIDEVETPCGIVDLARVRHNLSRTASYARTHGLKWRPHVKTHKSLELGRMQLDAGAQGFTVATLREAEVMSRLTDDLLLAHPPFGRSKLERVAALAANARLGVALDSHEALAGVAAAGRDGGRDVRVFVEIDLGMKRVGVAAPEIAVRLAAAAAGTSGVEFGGLLFYPGHIRSPVDEQSEDLAALGTELERFLDALDAAGLTPPVVSGGSTPTLWRSHEIPGLTEIRPGTSIFHDRDMLSLGVCEEREIAYHVLATVVSTAVPGQVVVDAGAKALAKEELRAGREGYGFVADHPEVRVVRVSEEHGVLDLEGTGWVPRLGERVRIVPNHVCVSVNLQDRLLEDLGEEGFRPVALEARGRLA